MPLARKRASTVDEPLSNRTVRVMIVDDHRVLAELLSSALSDDDAIVVVGTAATATEAIPMVASLLPDVVILDYDLPDADGVSTISSILAASPRSRVLMLTSYTDPAILNEAIAAGCSGFVTKRNSTDRILSAVLAVASSETPVSPDMVRSLMDGNRVGPGSNLTARELEILRIAAQGRTNREIADQLSLSVNTVRNHMQHVLNKLGAHSKLEATAVAVRLGLVRR